MELLFNVIEKVPTISWRGVFEHTYTTGRCSGVDYLCNQGIIWRKISL